MLRSSVGVAAGAWIEPARGASRFYHHDSPEVARALELTCAVYAHSWKAPEPCRVHASLVRFGGA